jgi:hypothetical protein
MLANNFEYEKIEKVNLNTFKTKLRKIMLRNMKNARRRIITSL